MTTNEAILPIITSLIAAGISIYTVILQRRKVDSETEHLEANDDNELVTTALSMVATLRGEVATLRADLNTERNERQRKVELLTEQLASKDEVIAKQAVEILELKRELNRLSRRIGTGDLPTK